MILMKAIRKAFSGTGPRREAAEQLRTEFSTSVRQNGIAVARNSSAVDDLIRDTLEAVENQK